MDLTGKVVSILPQEEFSGSKGKFVRCGFVIETGGQYPKRVKFDVLGEDRWSKLSPAVHVGADVQVFFDVSSREWNGKWFTQCDAYRVSVVGSGVSQSASHPVSQPRHEPASPQQDSTDNLPF